MADGRRTDSVSDSKFQVSILTLAHGTFQAVVTRARSTF